jgi:hypothetical protein
MRHSFGPALPGRRESMSDVVAIMTGALAAT